MGTQKEKGTLAVMSTADGGQIHVTSVKIEVPADWEPGMDSAEPMLVAEGTVPGRRALVQLGFVRITAGSAAGAVMVKPLESIPVWHELAEVAPLARAIESSPVVAEDSNDEVDPATSAVARNAVLARFIPDWAAECPAEASPRRSLERRSRCSRHRDGPAG